MHFGSDRQSNPEQNQPKKTINYFAQCGIKTSGEPGQEQWQATQQLGNVPACIAEVGKQEVVNKFKELTNEISHLPDIIKRYL